MSTRFRDELAMTRASTFTTEDFYPALNSASSESPHLIPNRNSEAFAELVESQNNLLRAQRVSLVPSQSTRTRQRSQSWIVHDRQHSNRPPQASRNQMPEIPRFTWENENEIIRPTIRQTESPERSSHSPRHRAPYYMGAPHYFPGNISDRAPLYPDDFESTQRVLPASAAQDNHNPARDHGHPRYNLPSYPQRPQHRRQQPQAGISLSSSELNSITRRAVIYKMLQLLEPNINLSSLDRCFCMEEYTHIFACGRDKCHIPCKISKCGHVFGQPCLVRWLEEQDTCPMCRVKLDIPGLDLNSRRVRERTGFYNLRN
ncbi:hypothetical protein ACMFMG_006153 [Clarireedia jacksonii]